MRSAKISAKLPLERSSCRVMVSGAEGAVAAEEEEGEAVTRFTKGMRLLRAESEGLLSVILKKAVRILEYPRNGPKKLRLNQTDFVLYRVHLSPFVLPYFSTWKFKHAVSYPF
jgi:hypothetical protein